MDVKNKEGIEYLNDDVEDGSVDLILTDPPYVISKSVVCIMSSQVNL